MNKWTAYTKTILALLAAVLLLGNASSFSRAEEFRHRIILPGIFRQFHRCHS